MMIKYRMRITLKNIEENVAPIGGRAGYDKEFIYELLTAYGRSTSNITRLRNGSLNVADNPAEDVAQKNIVFFRPVTNGENLYATIDTLKSDQTVVRYSTRFVVVTDYTQILAIDTKTNETLDIPLKEIDKYFTFFLPWAGMEKSQYVAENHADIKAAYKMSKLFDEIVSFNHHAGNIDYYHGLNVFFCRLLFCFFSEDTEIFEKGQFTRGIESYTQVDGSDLAEYLDELFFALDAEDKDGYPSHIKAFPYVNGGLFYITHKAPRFNTKARQLILECGKLNWSDINPDIFGSMIQAVVNPGQRGSLGMHYTSVPNIMKTIEPLFLNELKEEFNKHYDNKAKLEKLLGRIGNIRVFDPACGSGNFLIIAYKELRKLEHALIERIDDLTLHQTNRVMFSRISIENFYGIEIDDFAHEVAILSLWLAKHQMNLEFKQKFGSEISLIPLKEAGNILRGNATRTDWSSICPNNGNDEIYLIGNPPYQGSNKQSKVQKSDMAHVFASIQGYKNLDYIACWFKLGCDYINGSNAKLAFVSTNSISQGEQVGLLWPYLLKKCELSFVYQSFRWSNYAKSSAGVTCVIISLRPPSNMEKVIFTLATKRIVKNITPYLAEGDDLIIYKRSRPLSSLPIMTYGSKPVDGGNLILNESEKDELISQNPDAEKFIKKFMGADEFLHDKKRWCLWITDKDYNNAISIQSIKHRIEAVETERLKSKKQATQKLADIPYKFGEIRYSESESLIIPSVTSEGRDYIPIGYIGKDVVVSNRSHTIFNSPLYVFGLISSRMHMVWTNAVAGRLETRINYSSQICYNNFPVPPLNPSQQDNIETKVHGVLDAREHHTELTLAEMYRPDSMPHDLQNAHLELNETVDMIYRRKPFDSDQERLEYLFGLYESMVSEERVRILS